MPRSQSTATKVRAPLQRALGALVFALGLSGCGEARHAVGQVQAESQRSPEPRPASAGAPHEDDGAAGTPSAPSAADAGLVAVADAGALPPPEFAPGDLPRCGALALAAERKRLDLYLMVDNNVTLTLPQPDENPWDALLRGIDSYVEQDEAAGTGVGVDYFGFQCSADTYAMPTVPVHPLPENAAAIQASLASVVPINVSPMLPALEGAIMHARSRANSYHDSKQAVVLISDGYADLFCGSSTTNVSAAAASGVAGTPSIPTYVVALDVPSLNNILNPLTRLDSLDAIARQGGTGRAHRIDLQNSTDVFVEAMLEVQRDAESCEYSVPQIVRDEPDRLSLGVLVAPGLARALAPLSAASECGDGFHFDAEAKWAVLCPSVCDEVKQSRADLIWFTDC